MALSFLSRTRSLPQHAQKARAMQMARALSTHNGTFIRNYEKPLKETLTPPDQYFGINVFDLRHMKDSMANSAIEAFYHSLEQMEPMSAATADTVAKCLLRWAADRGATHYTHWFQPLTGSTAEKHDSFLDVSPAGVPLSRFRGKDLIMGEPDGSSFPSGGLRRTHLARGYSVWDVNSPPFVVKNSNGATLYIPSVFFSWNGDLSLDDKIPLLRSDVALSREASRLFKVVGRHGKDKIHTDSGLEQEFFLIHREHALRRPDIINCGRTLIGAHHVKGQQLEDHYFGQVNKKMLDAIHALEVECWKLGIPIQTRHAEVAPGQYEVAPKFARSSVATDRNHLLMQQFKRIARDHDLHLLLHEKPFAGVNGSGKHNNWSVGTSSIPSLLEPGEDPQTNTQFMLFLAATLAAVDKHADLLRISISGAGNDHRLGANEAPPAIISAYLGDDIDDAVRRFVANDSSKNVFDSRIDLGIPSFPVINRQRTDRNRTSPFAFTGNKFEFRAVGASQNPARSNVVLNTIIAAEINEMTNEIQKQLAGGALAEDAMRAVSRERLQKHSRIIFNGNGYSQEWRTEAEKRGLLNLRTTPQALRELNKEKNLKLFESQKVLKRDELLSRKNVFEEEYVKKVLIEAETLGRMIHHGVIPAGLQYQANLTGSIGAAAALKSGVSAQTGLLHEVSGTLEKVVKSVADLRHAIHKVHKAEEQAGSESAARASEDLVLPAMAELRVHADHLETITPAALWPYPTYHEMLFHQD